jgi:DsbC/DsbD-like thiol-disulfide interchange protein
MQLISAAVVLSMAVPAGAQAHLPRERQHHELPQHETAHLTIAASASVETAAPGQTLSLNLDIAPKPGMHVYAPGQPGYIAVALTLDADPAFAAAKARYPAGEKLRIPALNETQIVYVKPFRITQDVSLAATPEVRTRAAGDRPSLVIRGTLRYQACDDRICYLPATVPVEWTVRLSPSK